MDEHKMLAKKIYEIEHADIRQRKEWLLDDVKEWRLSKSVVLRIEEDPVVWYLWKTYPDQARPFLKIIPRLRHSELAIKKMLKAQSWVCI